MKSTIIPLLLALLVLPAHAALIEKDLFAPGDGLITLDDQTGLEWLDVNATLGLTYNQAQASAFVQANGFDHASSSQVLQLYTSLGLTNSGVNYIPGNFAGSQTLLNLLGCTGRCSGSDFPYQWGLFNKEPFDASNADTADATLNLSASTARVKGFQDSFTNKNSFSNAELGNYLVREAVVPVPAAAWLFASALILLGWLQRRPVSTRAEAN